MESCVTGRLCVGCLSRIVPEYSSAITRTFFINNIIVVAISQILSSIHLNSNDFSSKGPNYQLGVLITSGGAIEGHFQGKTPLEVHQGGLVLARQCPGSPGTWNPEQSDLPGLPVSSSPTLFFRSGPDGLPPVPCTEKNN